MMKESAHNEKYRLIITIVKKGLATRVITASKTAGAEGGTVLLGRGTPKEISPVDFLDISVDPEREIIFTLVKETQVKQVLHGIEKEAQLNKPGHGMSFVLTLTAVAGIAHQLKQMYSTGGLEYEK